MIQKKRSFHGPVKKTLTRDLPKVYAKLTKGGSYSNIPEKKFKSLTAYLASFYKLTKLILAKNTKKLVVGHLQCDYKILNNKYLYVRYLEKKKKLIFLMIKPF